MVKKQRSNHSNVDFVIVDTAGAVKEVVKKKKKTGDADDVKKKKKRKKEEPSKTSNEEAKPTKKNKSDDEAKPTKKKKRDEEPSKKKKSDEEPSKKKPDEDDGPFEARATKKRAVVADANPRGVTRLFVGNLPFSITDESLAAALGCPILAVKYITDKDTKRFYGSAFVEVGDVDSAANAVGRSGSDVGGRPVKITYAPPRPGDVWPPVKATPNKSPRERSDRPEGGTTKLFVGNVAYEADEDEVIALFTKDVAPDGLKAVRWLTHKDTGEFRGSGFLDFYTIDQADNALRQLDGADLKGRKIRLDYA